MECIPKCTKMLQVNQPIRVQPEVKGGGGGVWVRYSTVQYCQTDGNSTCTRDVSNKMHERSCKFWLGHFLIIPSGVSESDP